MFLIIQMLPRPASTLSSPLPSIVILSCLSLASLPCSPLFHLMPCHPHFLTPLISSFFSLLQINLSTCSNHIHDKYLRWWKWFWIPQRVTSLIICHRNKKRSELSCSLAACRNFPWVNWDSSSSHFWNSVELSVRQPGASSSITLCRSHCLRVIQIVGKTIDLEMKAKHCCYDTEVIWMNHQERVTPSPGSLLKSKE